MSNDFPAHLHTLEELSTTQIQTLLDTAQAILSKDAHKITQFDLLKGRTLMTAFFANSTRTKLGFSLAGLHLGAQVLHFDPAQSSLHKGETPLDTLQNLAAMGTQALIVRSEEINLFADAIHSIGDRCTLINAGNGNQAHPGQGLIDLFTITRHKKSLHTLRVVIVGDIKHSRVAPSDIIALQKMGVRDISVVGPKECLPEQNPWTEVDITHDFDAALANADVVIMLRIQHERMPEKLQWSQNAYHQKYGLTAARLRLAKPDAIVMHPGPINRGVEISDEVADGEQSVILEQVENGIALRMAILTHFIKRH